jgi:hypothetical protein
VENAVVFDMEKQIRVENLTGYSYSGLVETYFENDKYSNYVKKKLQEYEKYIEKSELDEDDLEEIEDLEDYFESIPDFVSIELKMAYKNLKIKKLTEHGKH